MHRQLHHHHHLPTVIACYVLHAMLVACCCNWQSADAATSRSISPSAEVERGLRLRRPVRSLASAVDDRSASGVGRLARDLTAVNGGPSPLGAGVQDRKYSDDLAADEDDMKPESVEWEPEVDESVDEQRDFDKRKWGDNKARVWGKRKWGENKARIWGKRRSPSSVSGLPAGAATGLEAEHRAAADFLDKFQAENRKLVDEALMGEKSGKRKWGENKARVWGKRDAE